MAIITISRGSYSGGRTLAECLAKRLGYDCMSREENLEAAASMYGIAAEKLSAEKAPSMWDRLGGEAFPYITYVRAALCDRARNGNLVYHGYLGHLLLPGIPHVLRVRIMADMEYRTEAVMRWQGLERSKAVSYIEGVDRERREWTRFLFGVEWDDLSGYHAVFNLGLMTMETACDTVAHIAEQPQFAQTDESNRAMNDLALKSLVAAALARDPRTSTADLTVESSGGTVTVSGTGRNQQSVDAVRTVAGAVEGVRELSSKVVVRTPYLR